MPNSQNFDYYYFLGGAMPDGSTTYSSISNTASIVSDTEDAGPNDGMTAVGDEVDWDAANSAATTTLVGFAFNGDPVFFVSSANAYFVASNDNSLDGVNVGLTTTGTYFYCFLPGTQIATAHGERLIEELSPGETVSTVDGRETEILWVGRQTVTRGLFSAQNPPVRITAGALSQGLPHSDLCVSPEHGIILDGALVNASALVNGDTIRFMTTEETGDQFTYFHVETKAHEQLIANGAAAESFVDAASRKNFDNYDAYLERFGAERIIPEMGLPRVTTRRQLPQHLRERLFGPSQPDKKASG